MLRLLFYSTASQFAGLAIFFVMVSGCIEDPVHALRVGTNVWPGYEPLYLARSLDYFDDKAIRLVEYSSTSNVLQAFRNNALEAAAVTLDEALLLLAEGHQPKLILIMDISMGGDAVIGQLEIQSLAKLKGKTVGVESTALGAFMLLRAIEQANLQIDDIAIKNVNVDKHESVFNKREVDAVVTFEPVRTRLLEQGANQLFDSSLIPSEIVDVLAIHEEAYLHHRSQIRLLLQSWFKALAYLNKNPIDATTRMASRENISPEAFRLALQGLKYPNLKENIAMLCFSPPNLLKTSEKLAQVMLENRLLPAAANAQSLFGRSNILEELDHSF
jgi:NitT/TauT family transport system substrate-binding protein